MKIRKGYNPTICNSKKIRITTAETGKFPGNDFASKKIKCNETNEVFPSMSAAATKLKISLSSISKNLNNDITKKIKGYSFQYLK